VVNEETLLTDLNERIRDVRVFDGAVYVLTKPSRSTSQCRQLRLHATKRAMPRHWLRVMHFGPCKCEGS